MVSDVHTFSQRQGCCTTMDSRSVHNRGSDPVGSLCRGPHDMLDPIAKFETDLIHSKSMVQVHSSHHDGCGVDQDPLCACGQK